MSSETTETTKAVEVAADLLVSNKITTETTDGEVESSETRPVAETSTTTAEVSSYQPPAAISSPLDTKNDSSNYPEIPSMTPVASYLTSRQAQPTTVPPQSSDHIPSTNPSFSAGSTSASMLNPSGSSSASVTTKDSRAGGRLWKLAGQQVKAQQHGAAPPLLPVQRTPSAPTLDPRAWAETLFEGSRSCAVPDAGNGMSNPGAVGTTTCLDNMPDDDDSAEHDALVPIAPSKRRNKVAQLLLTGIVAILGGWLGTAYVFQSCHFASVPVTVGQYATQRQLQFGLYKYSPLDSSLNGYVLLLVCYCRAFVALFTHLEFTSVFQLQILLPLR